MKPEREVLFCDCCGTEGLAYQEKERVVIVTRRHGKKHVLTVVVGRPSKPAEEVATRV
ncbi:MAG: hypothetical protein C1O27_001432 [Chloroflexi bacterium]|jgi:hypothetical protein|nr:MAG: hypothetical protein C1O27_001432 [Chloroflexota bacterium]